MKSLENAIGKGAAPSGESKKKNKGKKKGSTASSSKVREKQGSNKNQFYLSFPTNIFWPLNIATSQVVPDTPLQKAAALVNRILKEANTCRLLGSNCSHVLHLIGLSLTLRDQAFKLKPLSLSSDLIDQLKACAVKLGKKAEELQSLIHRKKNKNKHYVEVTTEVVLHLVLNKHFKDSLAILVLSFWYSNRLLLLKTSNDTCQSCPTGGGNLAGGQRAV